ncbi:MAG: restriction endonuclease subunit S [Erythrobacter sp.]
MSAVAEPLATTTRVVPLVEAVELNPRPDRSELPDALEVSFVPMAAVAAATGRMDATAIRPFAEVKKGYTVFREGDVLFAKITPCMENGKMAVARGLRNGVGCGSTEFHVLRPRPGVDPQYVYHFVSSASFRAEAAHHMTGAVGQKRVPAAFLETCEIPLPDLGEQRRIVAELEKQFSRLDQAVANLKRVRANVKRYESAVLRAAVEGRLVKTEAEVEGREGASYETGSQLLARVLLERRRRWIGKGTYQDPAGPGAEGLPPLPEGWAWARLDAVAALKGGITVDKKRRDSTARSIAYLRVANVKRGYLDLDEVKEIEAPQTDIEELRLQPGDILFNEGGDRDKLGRGWIWEGQLAECIHQNHVFRARPYLPEVSGKLISWWGNTFGKDYFLREGKQTTNLASINMTKLSAFPVPIPPVAEQRRIVAEVDRRLSIVREVEAEIKANLKRTTLLRRAVLSRAFG